MKWIVKFLRRLFCGFLFLPLCILCSAMTSSCAFPGAGWYQRVEQNLSDTREAVQKNQENTRLLAKNTDDEKLKSEWEKRLSGIRKSGQAPANKNTGDWIETLLYILLGLSGLGGMAKGAHFLYKIPPRQGMKT